MLTGFISFNDMSFWPKQGSQSFFKSDSQSVVHNLEFVLVPKITKTTKHPPQRFSDFWMNGRNGVYTDYLDQSIYLRHWQYIMRYNSTSIYLIKVSNRNIRTRCEICSMLTIKTSERQKQKFTSRSGVFIVKFKHISRVVLVFLLLTLNM